MRRVIEHPRVRQVVGQYQQLTRREQLIINITIEFLLVMLVVLLVLEPLWKDIVFNRQRTQSLNDGSLTMETQTLALQRNPVNDPNPPLRSQQEQLQQQLGMVQERNHQQMAALVSPQQLARVLEQVLAETPSLQLISLENLPPEPLLTAAVGSAADTTAAASAAKASASKTGPVAATAVAAASQASAAGSHSGAIADSGVAGSADSGTILWRHGLRLHLKATWPAVLDYLQRMQQLPGTLHWQGLEYHQKEYPWGEITLEVFTISVSREVVGA